MSTEARREATSKAWSLLRAGGQQSTGVEIPTLPCDVTTQAGPARFALGEHGEARLLLPLEKGETARGFFEAPSLRILVSTYVTDGKATRYLDLTCVVSELEPVFSEVAVEMLARIGGGQGCVPAAQSTIRDFRRLLLRSQPIPTTAIGGLVGELFFLRRLLTRAPDAWRTWRGPLGDRHDFRSANHSLEVKTSLQAATAVTVSSIDQMAPPSGGRLHLLHLRLEQVAGGQLTVSTLGRTVLSQADDPDQIRARLSALGCADVEARQWNTVAFRLEQEALYLVDDHFPKLTSNMLPGGKLPLGVINVTYRIDLSKAQQSQCVAAEVDAVETSLIA